MQLYLLLAILCSRVYTIIKNYVRLRLFLRVAQLPLHPSNPPIIIIAESSRKLPHLFIPNKIVSLVPEFAMEDLLLGRIAALMPEFAVKDLPLGSTLMMMIMAKIIYYLKLKG